MTKLLLGIGLRQKRLSIISFTLFSAWLLSVPFEGQILYARINNSGVDKELLFILAIFANFLGLFICGFFVKRQDSAKVTMIISLVVCIAGSLIFFLPFSMLWYLAIVNISFFAGLLIASWGFYYKAYSEFKDRFKTAADVIIYSNILMIFLSVLTTITTAFIALGTSIVLLIAALLLVFRLDDHPIDRVSKAIKSVEQNSVSSSILKPLLFLYIFILIITINSGLMYRVVSPAFEYLAPLTNYYWAMPYILALVILRNLPRKFNQSYILYIALAMVGLAFIAFMRLDSSFVSYLIIDTLMLGAFGVFDLFWWSVLGGFLDYSKMPAQIFGVGLSMNVMGIFLGGIIAKRFIVIDNDYITISVIALIVIFIVLIMLPILNTLLTKVLRNHVFLNHLDSRDESEQQKTFAESELDKQLTEKEKEVVQLLLRGYTYKGISGKLHISENTMKFHIKNIYQKLHINNKMELIRMFSDDKR
ncbi:MAG: hypothetical protein APF84_16805 [Gracilibacter sp. BRH_c7a]|nr:MAG: hypothetical protein APF84_16805 [Gracilibacter sp. BRH_c7a]